MLRQVAKVFGLGTPEGRPRRVGEAWSGEVYRVRTRSGEYAVKLFPPGLRAERLAAIRRAIAFEAAVRYTGEVPMPVAVPSADTGAWLASTRTRAGLRLARCHRWVQGLAATAAQPLALSAVRDAGRSLAVLHAAGVPAGDTGALSPVDLERWHRAVTGADLAGLSWAAELAALTPLVEELAAGLEELRGQRRPMVFSHHDLDPKNAVLLADGRVALTGWDGAGPVLPDVELVTAAASFAGAPGTDETSRELIAAFVAAYCAAGGTAEPGDRQAMAAESPELGRLLGNVEPCISAVLGTRPSAGKHDLDLCHRTARDLIGSFARDVEELWTCADRLRAAVQESKESKGSTGPPIRQ